jgi:DNA-binding IclR family transcriptional regulator
MQQEHATYTLSVPFIERRPQQLNVQEALKSLREAADEISQALMYRPPRIPGTF